MIRADEVSSNNVIASGAAFVNDPVGIDQIVVANILPGICENVKIPDAANYSIPARCIIRRCGVVKNDVGDICIGRCSSWAVLAIGASPFSTTHEGKLRPLRQDMTSCGNYDRD